MIFLVFLLLTLFPVLLVNTGSGLEKDGDWVRLAEIVVEASKNHNIYSYEIADLCTKMRNGKLKGYASVVLLPCFFIRK